MKPVIISALMLVCIAVGIALVPFARWFDMNFSSPSSNDPVPVKVAGPGRIPFDDLLDAIEWKESKGDPMAVGVDGEVGAYQLKKIYVDDVNRIAALIGSDCRMSYTDRLDRDISRAATSLYLTYYGGTFEEMARKHKGGPQGHKKESTKPYWAKVRARLTAKELQ